MLRPYQQEAVDTLFKKWGKGDIRPCILCLSTGAGKSWVISEIINRVHEPVLVLQPSKEILEQNVEKLELSGFPAKDIAVCSASAGSWEIDKVTFATIGTIAKHYKYCKHFTTIIVDECDCVNCDEANGQYLTFFNNLRGEGVTPKITGLTACVDGDTEVLTRQGWVKFMDLKGENGVFAQWEPPVNGDLGKIYFDEASIYRGWAQHINSSRWEKEGTEFLFTDGHTIPIQYHKYDGSVYHKDEKAGQVKWNDHKRLYMAGAGAGLSQNLSTNEVLGLFLQADGCFWKKMEKGKRKGQSKHTFEIRKPHKCEYIIPYLEEKADPWRFNSQGYLTGEIYLPFNAKDLSSFVDLQSLSFEKAQQIIDVISHFDGHKYEDGSIEYYSTNEKNVDIIQAVATLGGYMNRKVTVEYNRSSNRQQPYKLYIRPHATRTTSGLSKEKQVNWGKPVYCLHTKTGYFVARKNGRVFITGNTPFRNQSFRDKNGLPTLYCRPLTRIHTTGGKGTPYGDWFWTGGIIYKCEIPYLQELGYLVKTKYYQVDTDWSFVKNYPTTVDFDTDGMTQWMENDRNLSRFHQAVAWCKDNGFKTIVFTPNIEMNGRLTNCIRSLGATADTMDSLNDSRKSRQAKMGAFRTGGFQFLVNVGMMGRGVDVPSVDCVILARPTKSLQLYMQYIGRALRLDPEQPDKIARIIDLSGNVARFGRVEDVHLTTQKQKCRNGYMMDKDIIAIKKNGKDYKWEKLG